MKGIIAPTENLVLNSVKCFPSFYFYIHFLIPLIIKKKNSQIYLKNIYFLIKLKNNKKMLMTYFLLYKKSNSHKCKYFHATNWMVIACTTIYTC